MALADPQVVSVDPAISLDRISSEMGKFGNADLTYELSVAHSRKGRARHVLKLSQRKISADPLLPSQNREYSQSVHILIDHPIQGFTATEVVNLATVFVEYAATAGFLADLVQGQA
jgi:hypothetical protein